MYEEILEYVRLSIESLNIGNVYDYMRWSTNWSSFLSLFKYGKKISGWMVTRTKTLEEPESYPYHKREYTFKIYGFHSLKDDEMSEKTFQGMIESICDKFRGDPTLGGKVIDSNPVQVLSVELREFGDVLCHFVELELTCWERRSVA